MAEHGPSREMSLDEILRGRICLHPKHRAMVEYEALIEENARLRQIMRAATAATLAYGKRKGPMMQAMEDLGRLIELYFPRQEQSEEEDKNDG